MSGYVIVEVPGGRQVAYVLLARPAAATIKVRKWRRQSRVWTPPMYIKRAHILGPATADDLRSRYVGPLPEGR